jgi:hypothetical protein
LEKYQTRAFILSFSQNKNYLYEDINLYNENKFTETATAYPSNAEGSNFSFKKLI